MGNALRGVLRSVAFSVVSLGALGANPSSAAAEEILQLPIGDPARRDRDAPVVLDGITDTGSARVLTPAELPAALALAGVRLLLVGEEHTSMESHRIERRVIEALDRSGRRVEIGLEMFPYTQQPVLDDWSAGKLTEEAFLESSHWYKHWGYNWGYYRDVFLYARDHRLRMFAVNAPREVVSAVRKKGFQGLTPEEAAHVPTRVDTDSPEHMRLFRASFTDAGFHAGMDEAQWQAMLSAQCTWDATMAFHATDALSKDPDPKAIVVVLAGSGHVQYGMGIERQARQWYAGKVASLIPIAVTGEKGEPVRSARASYASFFWGVPFESEPLFPDLGVSTRAAEGDSPLVILHVEDDSPAGRAGVKAGDALLTLDGVAVGDRETLARAMAEKRWGDGVVLGLRREKEPLTLTIPLRRAK